MVHLSRQDGSWEWVCAADAPQLKDGRVGWACSSWTAPLQILGGRDDQLLQFGHYIEARAQHGEGCVLCCAMLMNDGDVSDSDDCRDGNTHSPLPCATALMCHTRTIRPVGTQLRPLAFTGLSLDKCVVATRQRRSVGPLLPAACENPQFEYCETTRF